ncbi:MAG: site-specific integrase [Actinomycetota bacterium]|nr:site-specific integrase [Actinomycetota bacterium]
MARPRKLGYGEGTVYYDESVDLWRGAITIDGARRRVSGHTRQAALQALDRLRSDRANATPIGDDMRLSAWISWWLENVGAAKSDPAAATEQNYRWALEQASSIGGKRLRELTTADVEGLLRHLATRKPSTTKGRGGRRGPLGKSSLLRVRFALGVVLEEAQRRDMVGRNVARLARLPKTTETSRPRRSLSPAEADQLIAGAREDRIEALIGVMLYCGLRPGEATGLTWDCIDFAERTLTVRQSRKMLPDGSMVIGATKADSDRVQRLPDAIYHALKAHELRQQRERSAAPAWDDLGLVFPNGVGRYIDKNNLRREVIRLCRDAGIEPISPNELRHSAATLLVSAGASLQEVADFLGHKNTRMLQAVYRHKTRRPLDLTAVQGRVFVRS